MSDYQPNDQPASATLITAEQFASPERLDVIELLLTTIYDSSNLPTPEADLWQDKLRAYALTLAAVPTTELLRSYQRAIEAHKGPFAVTALEIAAAWRELSRETFQAARAPRPVLLLEEGAAAGDDEPPVQACAFCMAWRRLKSSGTPLAVGASCPDCGAAL